MSRRRSSRRLPDPDDVLRGRIEPRVEDLFELIHAINPSSRKLPESARREAYAKKAALQSLLIEHFGELLIVEPVADDGEDVVGLRHRTYAKDACHALCSQLTPEARSWVRLQLDSADAESAPGAPKTAASLPRERPGPADPESSLAKGDRALAEFDYGTAEQLYRSALVEDATTEYRVRAAVALLRLYVDHLADDERALQSWRDVPPDGQGDPELRCLLAVAAARSGDPDRARELVAELEFPRANDVWIEIARHALALGDLDACAAALERVPASCDSAAARQSVADALERRRAEAAADLAAQLDELRRSGDFDAVQSLAHRVLALQPEHEAARQALRDLRRDQDRRRAAELLREIEEALEREHPARARGLFSELLALASDTVPADLDRRIEDAEQRAFAHQEQVAVDSLARRLATTIDAETVRAYWDAHDRVRDRARQAIPEDHASYRWLAWIEALGPMKGHARCEAAALAAAALSDAERRLAGGDPTAAAYLLEPHTDLMTRSRAAARLLADVRSAVETRRSAEARQILVEAENLADDDTGAALARICNLDERALGPEERERAHQLRLRLQDEQTIVELRELARDAEARGDPLTARNALQQLARRTASEESDRWRQAASALDERIDAQWIEDRSRGPQVAVAHDLRRPRTLYAGIEENGETGVAVATQLGSRIFLRLLFPDPAKARGAIVHPPTTFELVGLGFEEGHLAVLARQGILWLEAESFAVRNLERWPASAITAPFDAAGLGVTTRFAWLARQRDEEHLGFRIADRTGSLPPTTEYEATALHAIQGGATPVFVASHAGSDWEILDERGRSKHRAFSPITFLAGTLAPGDSGVLILSGTPVSPDAGGGAEVEVRAFGVSGEPGPRLDLGHAKNPEPRSSAAATSTREDSAFVTVLLDKDRPELIAIGATGGELEERWRTPVPFRHALVPGPRDRNVVLQVDDGESITLTRLGPRPPRLPITNVTPENLPDFLLEEPCAWRSVEQLRHVAAFESVLRLLDTATTTNRITAWLEATTPPAEDLLALAACRLPRRAREAVLAVVRRAHLESPLARLLVAEAHVREGAHDSAMRLLENLDARRFEPQAARHVAHITALCQIALGATDDARITIKRAPRAEDCCSDLATVAAYVEALRAKVPSSPDRLVGATIPGFVGRLLGADRALARGDGAAALAFLEHPVIWAVRHRQCAARLAEAAMVAHPVRGPGTFRTREILAALLEQHRVAGARGRGSELGELAWSEERIRATVERAAHWLGENPVELTTLPEQKELDRFYAPPGPLTRTPVSTRPSLSEFVTVLTGAEHRERLARAAPRIARAIRDVRGPRPPRYVAGLVVDRDHPDRAVYRTVAERLLALPQQGDDTVVAVGFETVFQLLSDWPDVYGAFIRHLERAGRESSTVLLCPGGVAFGTV